MSKTQLKSRMLYLLANGYVNPLLAALESARRRNAQVMHVFSTELTDQSLLTMMKIRVKVSDDGAAALAQSMAQEVETESRRSLLNRWSPFRNDGVETPDQDRFEVGQGLPVLPVKVYASPATDGQVSVQTVIWMRADSATLQALLREVESLGLHLEYLAMAQDEVTPGYRELTMSCWAPRFDSALPELLSAVPGVLYARLVSNDSLDSVYHERSSDTGTVLSPMIARDLGALDVELLLEEQNLVGSS